MQKVAIISICIFLGIFLSDCSAFRGAIPIGGQKSIVAQVGGSRSNSLLNYGPSVKDNKGKIVGRDSTAINSTGVVEISNIHINLAWRERVLWMVLVLLFANIRPPHMIVRDIIRYYKRQSKI